MSAPGPFLWLGNHPGLDLVNTEPRREGRTVDLLPDLEAVAAWADHALGRPVTERWRVAQLSPAARRRCLSFVHDLRAALRSCLTVHPDDTAAERLNQVLSRASGSLAVRSVRDGSMGLSSPEPEIQLCLDVAAATLGALGLDRSRVRACADDRCSLLFLDQSKGGRRRWCDMAVCGNRAKVAAHQSRVRAGSTG